jgi:hypothetical protein
MQLEPPPADDLPKASDNGEGGNDELSPSFAFLVERELEQVAEAEATHSFLPKGFVHSKCVQGMVRHFAGSFVLYFEGGKRDPEKTLRTMLNALIEDRRGILTQRIEEYRKVIETTLGDVPGLSEKDCLPVLVEERVDDIRRGVKESQINHKWEKVPISSIQSWLSRVVGRISELHLALRLQHRRIEKAQTSKLLGDLIEDCLRELPDNTENKN